MRNTILSFRAIIRLQLFWFILISLGFIIGVISNESSKALSFFAGILVGIGASAFVSQPQQFLIRGGGDAVYLIENNILIPHIHHLSSSMTVDAFGGIWHEIQHVSNLMVKMLTWLFGKEDLDLKKAELYIVENSAFAILNDTRYGIPDTPTINKIWPDVNIKNIDRISTEQLNTYRPGRDLVSSAYWHKGKYR